ncbi:MAG: DeoR/GlpR transcriptional regulator [Aquifex sp.]|nr:MAG: DeoR/GlpR transcriptional regulator [Aquifex sp.]
MSREKERKRKILELLKEKERTPKELADIFKVSLMTIYRDIKELEKEGLIERKHGTISLKEDESSLQHCVICSKDIDGRFNVILFLNEGKKVHACCPHCGLMAFRKLSDKVESIIMKDFVSCNPVNAFTSWYVVGADISPCCSPSAFAFSDRYIAEKFSKGFGGKVLDFEDALEEIHRLMSLGTRIKLSL